MKPVKAVAAAISVALVIAATVVTVICDPANAVAATVNGSPIRESAVTASVERVRSSYGATDDETWASFLAMSGMTPASMREQAIQDLAMRQVVIDKAASEGVEVDDEAVDNEIQKARKQMGYTDDTAWQNALKQAGYTEQSYREEVKLSLLAESLFDKVVPETKITDEEFANYAASCVDEESMFIKSDNEADAKALLKKIKASDNVEKAMKDNGATSIGWSSEQANSELPAAYLNALRQLEKGDLSDVVSADGTYYIIYCTDSWVAPENGKVDVKSMPKALREALRTYAEKYYRQTACQQYIQELYQNADIKISDMPKGLPYDVSMEQENAQEQEEPAADEGVSTSDSTSEDDGASSSSESASK